jgi:hypothetical protein
VPHAPELDDHIDVVPRHELEGIVQQSDARILRTDDVEPRRVLVGHGHEPNGRTCPRPNHIGMLE